MIDILQYIIIEYSLFISGILFTLAALIISETGKIFFGSLLYLAGDLVYLIYALVLDNMFGIISLVFALVFGFRTLYKMHLGVFKKDLKDQNYKKNNVFYNSI